MGMTATISDRIGQCACTAERRPRQRGHKGAGLRKPGLDRYGNRRTRHSDPVLRFRGDSDAHIVKGLDPGGACHLSGQEGFTIVATDESEISTGSISPNTSRRNVPTVCDRWSTASSRKQPGRWRRQRNPAPRALLRPATAREPGEGCHRQCRHRGSSGLRLCSQAIVHRQHRQRGSQHQLGRAPAATGARALPARGP